MDARQGAQTQAGICLTCFGAGKVFRYERQASGSGFNSRAVWRACSCQPNRGQVVTGP